MIAESLRASLTEAGYDVWIDREHMRSDEQHFSIVLQKALENSNVVIALLSPHSVRGLAEEDQRSSICYNEVRVAEFLQLPIVPVRVQKFQGMPPFLIIKYRQIDWLDWQEKDAYRRGVAEILQTIEQLLAGGKNLDSDIAYQAADFTRQLATARDDFAGREWLFSRLNRWLESDRPCFLIEGMTGSGKTAVVAELVRRNSGGRILAYHFCGASARMLDPVRFVLSIAGMVATSIRAYAEQLWGGALGRKLSGSDPQAMLSEGVLAPLNELKMEGTFYIAVDALDEATATAEAQPSLPQLLAGALGEFPPWLKLLVTTRPHGRIEGLFQGAEICVLGETVENQRLDLKAYVEKQLAGPPLDQKIDQNERERAARLIEDRSGGSFQYASMVLRALGRGEMALAEIGELRKGLAELYDRLAQQRFRDETGFDDRARAVLGVLLAAREPLTLKPLAMLSGLEEPAKVWPALNALSCFIDADPGDGADRTWRIAHSSIRDWLLSTEARVFQINPTTGRMRLLEYCLQWKENQEAYALKHVIGHLLEVGRITDALQAIEGGLFKDRLAQLNEPRFDADDSRNLTLALIGTHDDAGIVKLARTTNVWQRDGVAAALQSAPEKDLGFIDGVVGTLLKLQQ